MKELYNNSIQAVKGGITSAKGFAQAGIKSGIKTSKGRDLAALYSKKPCCASGTFTTNSVKAACVKWNKTLLPSENIHTVICNSGNANACTGNRGKKDVYDIATQTAHLLNIKMESVLIASTGIIGEFMPMNKVRRAIPVLISSLSKNQKGQFASAIMTTDTKKKECAVKVSFSEGSGIIGGCAKGSGMVNPNMATMLAFIATDIKISAKTLNAILKEIVGMTFNNLTIDGDTSTNDMVLALANGSSSISVKKSEDIAIFKKALFYICNKLCVKLAEDGEGATKRIEIHVSGGKTNNDCKAAAKAVANSNLVKTAIFGCDPNWGRILCAVGYSGARFSEKNISISLCSIPVYCKMHPVSFLKYRMHTALKKRTIVIDIDLGHNGKGYAIAHTCDLTCNYIKINAEYHT